VCGRENRRSSAVHGGNRCESRLVCVSSVVSMCECESCLVSYQEYSLTHKSRLLSQSVIWLGSAASALSRSWGRSRSRGEPASMSSTRSPPGRDALRRETSVTRMPRPTFGSLLIANPSAVLAPVPAPPGRNVGSRPTYSSFWFSNSPPAAAQRVKKTNPARRG